MLERPRDNDILLRLAEQLPEELIQELFPDIAPQAVRKSLRRISGCRPTSSARKSNPKQATHDNQCAGSPFLKEQAKSCMLYTDGASRGNPGEAGAGAVLLNDSGREVGTRALYLGQCTNNVAEYQALIAGLKLANEYGCNELHVFLDSELIVRQITGRYRVKNVQLKPLFIKVMNLLGQLENWQIRHVPRAENARADELANRGIDERE